MNTEDRSKKELKKAMKLALVYEEYYRIVGGYIRLFDRVLRALAFAGCIATAALGTPFLAFAPAACIVITLGLRLPERTSECGRFSMLWTEQVGKLRRIGNRQELNHGAVIRLAAKGEQLLLEDWTPHVLRWIRQLEHSKAAIVPQMIGE